MFNTIKAKIIAITVSMLLMLTLILIFFASVIYENGKNLIIKSCDYTINSSVAKINKDVSIIENNAIDLAIMGEIYYNAGKKREIAEYIVTNTFDMYENPFGGGIWFEPYKINPHKRLNCIYAFRNRSDNIIIDKSHETEDYNYLDKSWYKEIKSRLYSHANVAWSLPYHDKDINGQILLMVTAGAGIYDANENLVGLSTIDWKLNSIIQTVMRMQPTQGSFTLFADKVNDYIIVSTDFTKKSNLVGKSLKELKWYSEDLRDMSIFTYNGTKYVCFYKTLDNGMIIIVNVPVSELLSLIINHIKALLLILIFVSILVSVALYIVLQNNLKKPIDKLIKLANQIGQGDFDTKVKINKPAEFVKLANTFEKMANDIKSYVENINNAAKEREKMGSELMIAKTIQFSTIPNDFPPYPDRKEFDIYALMETAKEVGGDFYDFYFIDENHFMFLIADVSGKGIPAALFMMRTKTLVKNLAEMGYTPRELIQKINEKVCLDNQQGYFVTLFAGIVNLINGELTCLNCGHTPPLVKRHNTGFDYLKIEPNIALGVTNDIDFQVYETKLIPGDIIFLYTDGLTDIVNPNKVMFGEDRLKSTINEIQSPICQNILTVIKDNLVNYMDNEPPADDMTMLIFKYNSSTSEIKTYSTYARNDCFTDFRNWLLETLYKWGVDDNTIMKMQLSAEEIFTNIAFYGYENSTDGVIDIDVTKINDELTLVFSDYGIPYNPLEKPDPDISLPEELREIGGLGVYMVKKSCDDISYEYFNNKNILRIKFIPCID